MGKVNDIENRIKDYLDRDYEITEFKGVPSINNVDFGKKALKTKLITFSIDLRKSSQLLFKHHKQTAGKIHKAFLTAIAQTIKHHGGEIRDFQGDSILAFWNGNYQNDIRKAVKAAFGVKWLLTTKLKKYFENYTKLDYGIGIAYGEVYVFRAGIKRNPDNNDLVYIGKSVNFAVAMANQACRPSAIVISSNTHYNLDDALKISSKGSNMWKKGTIFWNGKNYDIKKTSYHITFS